MHATSVTISTSQKPHVRRKIKKIAYSLAGQGYKHLPRLAEQLGVSTRSLERLRASYVQGAFSFPEVDGKAKIIGICYRSESGRKFFEPGSSRGLYVPTGETGSNREPVLVVEGVSDTAACLTAGLEAVIGRPNNAGGADYLAEMLVRDFHGRPVIVVGENDQKTPEADWQCGGCGKCNRCWPGLYGAMIVAKRLGATVALPPKGYKDCREMLAAGKLNLESFVEAR